MNGRKARTMARDTVDLVVKQGTTDLRTRDHPEGSARVISALARMAAARVPDRATAAVLGGSGGDPAFVAVTLDPKALYLLRPLPFDASRQQHASASLEVGSIDPLESSVALDSRWWQVHGEVCCQTHWHFKIGRLHLRFTTERSEEMECPDDETFAVALCEAIGKPVTWSAT